MSHASAMHSRGRGKGKKKRQKKGLTERNSDNVHLPKLGQTYLKHPGEGTKFRNVRVKSKIRKELKKYESRICGLCGAMHAPGEPHKARNAASFNFKSGQSRPPQKTNRVNLSNQMLET